MFYMQAIFQLSSAASLNLGWSQNGVSGNGLTHYHTMRHFDALKIYSCGKHCDKRTKLLVTSNFSFSHNVFYSRCCLFFILNALKMSSAVFFFNLDQSKILSSGNGLCSLYTVDSAYLQVVFVRENIAIKRSARLPESSIQTGSLTELQMQTIVSFY